MRCMSLTAVAAAAILSLLSDSFSVLAQDAPEAANYQTAVPITDTTDAAPYSAVATDNPEVSVNKNVEPGFIIDSPDCNTVWQSNNEATILWSSVGLPADISVGFLLRDAEGDYAAWIQNVNISQPILNTGSYSWLVPDTLRSGQYSLSLYLTDYYNSTWVSNSTALFNISTSIPNDSPEPSIEFIYPVNGSVLSGNQWNQIAWRSHNVPLDINVHIGIQSYKSQHLLPREVSVTKNDGQAFLRFPRVSGIYRFHIYGFHEERSIHSYSEWFHISNITVSSSVTKSTTSVQKYKVKSRTTSRNPPPILKSSGPSDDQNQISAPVTPAASNPKPLQQIGSNDKQKENSGKHGRRPGSSNRNNARKKHRKPKRPVLKITEPTLGTVWRSGHSVTVSWAAMNLPNTAHISMELMDPGRSMVYFRFVVASPGHSVGESYIPISVRQLHWPLQNVPPGHYRLLLKAVSRKGTVRAISDVFTVV